MLVMRNKSNTQTLPFYGGWSLCHRQNTFLMHNNVIFNEIVCFLFENFEPYLKIDSSN